MPHILTTATKTPTLPLVEGDFSFVYKADGTYESLIKCQYKDKSFYLKQIKKGENYLIKLDKLSRISPIEIPKEAIYRYAKLFDGEFLHSNINLHTQKKAKSSPYLLSVDHFAKEFVTTKEIWIDIGFGSGRHLLHEAKKNPEIQFIGIEIHKPSIEQVLTQLDIQNLTNVVIISYDARQILELINSNQVGRIFVHFPVPWDKKPHRRVICKSFVEESLRVLKIDGTLELRTDSDNYQEYALPLFQSYNAQAKLITKTNESLEISSKYEDRWKKQQKNIYDLTLINTLLSPPKEHQKVDTKLTCDLGVNISYETHKEDEVFVHFEQEYVGVDIKVLKLSFGDPSKCAHQYLEISNGVATFFPNDPILFEANIKAIALIQKNLLSYDQIQGEMVG
jgi:tRNA (guanine-N7-)-methyltransferase